MEDRQIVDFKYIYREMTERAKMGDSCYCCIIEEETLLLTDAMRELTRRGFNVNLYHREDSSGNKFFLTVDWN